MARFYLLNYITNEVKIMSEKFLNVYDELSIIIDITNI